MKDEELVLKVKNGDNDSLKILIERYRSLIYSIINQYNSYGGDYTIDKDDLSQEASIALYEACLSFKDDLDVKFVTYAYTLIKRRISKKHHQTSKIYKSEGLSFDSTLIDDVNLNIASDRVYDNPKRSLMFKEMINNSYAIFNSLTEEEKNIIRLRRKSKSYQDIANSLNISVKKVDYRLQRIRKKIKEFDYQTSVIINA